MMRVFLLHLVFTLPGEPRTSPGVPPHFDNRNTTLLQMLDLTVHNLDRFFNEILKDSRKLLSGGLGESNHMIAILVRESGEIEDELVIRWKMDEGYK
ncbi:hypothetical protein Tco_0610487 [Tanacetum coccineum]